MDTFSSVFFFSKFHSFGRRVKPWKATVKWNFMTSILKCGILNGCNLSGKLTIGMLLLGECTSNLQICHSQRCPIWTILFFVICF